MRSLLLITATVFSSLLSLGQSKEALEKKRVHLPNGWSLTPVGTSLPLGDLPLNMAVSSSKKFLAVTNNGQSVQSLQLIDVKNERILHSVVIPRSWYGLKFSRDEKYLYASGGNDNWILQYKISDRKLILSDSIKLGNKWPSEISPTGIEIDDAKQILYCVTKEDYSLYCVDLKTKKVISKIPLGGEGYACVLSPDRKILYISCWGCDKILLFDTGSRMISAEIKVGDNPNELCLTKNGNFLMVTNANDNSVSVVDTRKKLVIETLNVALYPGAPSGSTSNGIALSEDERTLFIANADNNCLAVFDFSKPGFSVSKGFIPVGWYPTNVKVIGKKIFVSNGKGFSSKANVKGPNPSDKKEEVNYQGGDYSRNQRKVEYIGGLFKGTLSIINTPGAWQLGVYSKLVYDNTPYHKDKELIAAGEKDNPVPMKVGSPSPVKYVFYVIKENRTYDQVLSDIPGGNGDTSLLLFGEKITPNQHKLAREFVLLDNF